MSTQRIINGGKPCKRFTLVELLIVVAVLSILSALLLPALQKSVEIGRQVRCADNLKQIGSCEMMYADDYYGYVTPSHRQKGAAYYSWDDLLGAYDGRNLSDAEMASYSISSSNKRGQELYQCPSDRVAHNGVARSYAINNGYAAI